MYNVHEHETTFVHEHETTFVQVQFKGGMTRVMKISQNVWHYFHTHNYNYNYVQTTKYTYMYTYTAMD